MSRFSHCVCAILLLSTSSSAVSNGLNPVLEEIAIQIDAEGTTIALRFTPSLEPQKLNHFALRNPNRYVVDLYDTELGKSLSTPVVSATSIVDSVRTGQHLKRLRIVFDLKRPALGDRIELSLPTDASDTPNTLLLRFLNSAAKNTNNAKSRAADSNTKSSSADKPVPNTQDASSADIASDKKQPTVFVFGSADTSSSTSPVRSGRKRTGDSGERSDGWQLNIDRWLLENGALDSVEGTGGNSHLQGVVTIDSGRFKERWSMRLGARVDGQLQYANLPDYDVLEFDYDESWVRFHGNSWQVTAGAQRIIWGRTDELSPTDRLSTRDFTRLSLDPLEYRRRANPALRLEWFGDNQKLDLVVLPSFRESELPDSDSIWFPIDSDSGAVAGLPLPRELQPALVGAQLRNEISTGAGAAIRYSKSLESWDYALTVQRVNNPDPYFSLASPPTLDRPAQLDTIYPRTWVLGGDFALDRGRYTLRGELAYLSDSPYTDATDLNVRFGEELSWALGADIFPGDGDLRVTAQLTGKHLFSTENAIDFQDIVTLVGDIESPFQAAGFPWRYRLRYSVRLDESATYLNPELVFIALEPSEIYLGLHFFEGDYGTAEGFYENRDMIVIGWRGRF